MKVLFFSVLSVFLSAPVLAEERYVTYAAIGFDGKTVFAVEKRFSSRGGLLEGDSVIPVKYCEQESGFVCVQEGFTFAVPLNFAGDVNEWAFAGISYKLVGMQAGMFAKEKNPFSVKILNAEDKVYGIRSSGRENEQVFFYSVQNGLVGFTENLMSPYYSLTEKPYSTDAIYWLVGGCGIGCNEFESNIEQSSRAAESVVE